MMKKTNKKSIAIRLLWEPHVTLNYNTYYFYIQYVKRICFPEDVWIIGTAGQQGQQQDRIKRHTGPDMKHWHVKYLDYRYKLEKLETANK